MTKQNEPTNFVRAKDYLDDAYDAEGGSDSERYHLAAAQVHALLSIAEAVQALKGGEKPEPVDDTKPIPCPECGEVPVVERVRPKEDRFAVVCYCYFGNQIYGRTEAQAIARWNAAAGVT